MTTGPIKKMGKIKLLKEVEVQEMEKMTFRIFILFHFFFFMLDRCLLYFLASPLSSFLSFLPLFFSFLFSKGKNPKVSQFSPYSGPPLLLKVSYFPPYKDKKCLTGARCAVVCLHYNIE